MHALEKEKKLNSDRSSRYFQVPFIEHHQRTNSRARFSMKTTALLSSRRAAAPAQAVPGRATVAVFVSSNARAAAASSDVAGASPTTTSTSTTTTSSTPFASSRRALLASAAATAASLGLLAASPSPANAQISQKNTFTVDLLPAFELDVPASWTSSDAEVPGSGSGRPTRVWFPADDPLAPAGVNVSLVATIVGADFTSLGSFGDADGFGESLVATMDRGFAGGPRARLVSARSTTRRGKAEDSGPQKVYEVEYAVTRSEAEGERLFTSAVALSFDGTYNRLYTVTGQVAAGAAAERHGKEVAAIVKSFVPPATRV